MKIPFIYNAAEVLGIECLSSFLKSKGHETCLLFDPMVFGGDVFIDNAFLTKRLNLDRKIIDRAIELKPDLVAFSTYTGNYQWALRIAKAIRHLSNIPIVFGGVHPSAVPERVLLNEFIDYVIVGEGEYAMLDLVEHLMSNGSKDQLANTQNICFKYNRQLFLNQPRPYISDLDTLPFPDKALFYDKIPLLKCNPYLIMTSRGCPYRCTYCSNEMYQNLHSHDKLHVRRRSPDNVIEELCNIKKEGLMKRIVFMDDVFTLQKSWLEEFSEKYQTKIGLPFSCLVHPMSMSKDIAILLKETGCDYVGIGIQSGSERIREMIYNRKGSNDRIKQAMSYLHAAKINVYVDHILGAPTETQEDLEESLALYREIKPDMVFTFWLTYYPKTSIIQKARELGILSESDINKIEEGFIGYTHGTGAVSEKDIPMFARYELLFGLSALCRSQYLQPLLAKITPFIPFKKLISYFIFVIVGIRYNKDSIITKFRFALTKHNVP